VWLWALGGEMTQALYAHVNNKGKKIKEMASVFSVLYEFAIDLLYIVFIMLRNRLLFVLSSDLLS
jgi:hypothetical protein